MKKIIVFGAMMLVVAGAYAQGEAVSKFFSKYQSDDTFSQVTISSKMFGLFTNMEMENKEDQEVLDAISKLKGLKILAKDETRDARGLYDEANKMLPKSEYEELMYVRDKDKDMRFFINEKGGKINELVMIAGGSNDFMLLSVFGEIDLKQISKIGSKMDVDGLKDLERLKDNKKEKKN
ncbi:MAG TPA: DUF4252 domain-containing protein [Cyclobacteriaceae bacterium]|nr:DUF4252 domain-containing protein [Cyclobacteriaceae bacterium]HNP06126.1 DUF4252 domain-containing protein [Cyclobacteriaceae bacterium]HRK52529.1 DUF4252 domain-containing protein [Cyclobacteriaceae bacterium]